MKIEYIKDESGEKWWCESHHRLATHLLVKTECEYPQPVEHHCDPNLGGILLPCMCVKAINSNK